MKRLISVIAAIYLITIGILMGADVHFSVHVSAFLAFGWCVATCWCWKPVISGDMPSDDWVDY